MISALLLTLAVALAPATEARYPTKAPPNDGYVTSYRSYRSSVKCEATATTYNFAASKDAHAEAVTKAAVYACNTPYGKNWIYSVYKVYTDAAKDYDYGFAFARAIAATKAKCNSSGNAYGCASAYAYAQAWADAVFKAHAEAWAKALAKCKCDKEQIVKAQAYGKADEFYKLVAKVEALAKSSVCVKGDDYDVDSDAQTCIQEIYAHVFAYSLSKAIIQGFCVRIPSFYDLQYGNFVAKAVAEADAKIDIKEIKGCVGYIDLS